MWDMLFFLVFILIILFPKQTTFWNPKIVGSFWLEIYASHKYCSANLEKSKRHSSYNLYFIYIFLPLT